ncbi:MAG: metallophosphoesterase [Bacteroidales bacterium]|nr:metallophosphoesterase [Bacteroidales bacterium]
MRRSIRLMALAVAIAVVFTTGANAQKRLTIVHFNDTHSHVEPERSGDNVGHGGVIERAAYRDSVIKADGKKNVLLLHAGDYSQGTSYFTVLKGDLEIDLINALKYDCVTLGNHEFDNGVDELARRLANLNCPVVCANYDFSALEMGKYVKPCTVIKKAGMRIGIIGLMPDISTLVSKETSSKIPAFDNAEVVNKWAVYLREEEKCDLVIALTHIGYEDEPYTDFRLVKNTRGIDIVVGGHSHTFIKKPAYENNLDGVPVPIVQNGCWGLEVGNMKVYKKK